MITTLAEEIRAASLLMVVTGAGVSRASGISTFRGDDPGAVWANSVLEKGTRAYFLAHPGASWQWYARRFAGLIGARPNPAHHAIVSLERWQLDRGRGFSLVTQNVDNLHADAGSMDPIRVHGSARRVRCVRRGCELAAPKGSLPMAPEAWEVVTRTGADEDVPRCPACGGLLRPHVLWFDEMYTEHRDYRIAEVRRMSKRADVVLFVGTSFSVGVTDAIVMLALKRGGSVWSVDPVARPPHPRIQWIQAPAEDALPALVAQLA